MSSVASFFERRRAGLKAEAEAEAAKHADVAAEAAQEPSVDLDDLPEEDVLRLLNLPDPDTLKTGDDFAAFMAKAVPAYLRKRALRTLWRSNPVLACVDGLNDYDDDYRAMAMDQGPVRTSYQVGRGLLKHIEAMAAKEDAAATQDDMIDDADAASDIVTAAADQPGNSADTGFAVAPAPDAQSADTQPQAAQEQDAQEQDTPADADMTDAPAPRRMRFAFQGTDA
ncbi:DUF3306 domain-containing protein [Loktanella sp. SALINAS62]|uniref:DUF3306 domain-containing protein n=1 Tax=Loktanella sp. SALINAS62 TaxID=2706124 RepID=UPI001B8BE9AA|nr:DUF3306 domain-containing protein [Loktanella sp. SALINAS62]MBS1303727.1 DUF3306 domain-containing protein [Loktanella sp. SALINAS62]